MDIVLSFFVSNHPSLPLSFFLDGLHSVADLLLLRHRRAEQGGPHGAGLRLLARPHLRTARRDQYPTDLVASTLLLY